VTYLIEIREFEHSDYRDHSDGGKFFLRYILRGFYLLDDYFLWFLGFRWSRRIYLQL